MFDVDNLVTCLNREDGPEGCLHIAPQGVLEISSVTGQSPSLVKDHISSHGLGANPLNMLKGSYLHPKEHNITDLHDASNAGWGAHLDQDSVKGLRSDGEKRLRINVLELKAVFLALKQFRDQCHKQTMLIATDKSTVVAYINTGRNPLGRDVGSPVENHD